MMRILYIATLLAALLSIITARTHPFTATLQTARVQEMGEDVTCDVVITNNHDMEYYILTRDTPLEDLPSHIFKIKKGTRYVVKYDGFLLKRGPPMKDEYVRIPGKSSLSSTVLLSKSYGFDSASVYSITLDTQLLYSKSMSAATLTQPLSSDAAHFFLIYTGRNPKLTEPEYLRQKDRYTIDEPTKVNSRGYVDPGFYNEWPMEEKMLAQSAYSKAFNRVAKSNAAVDADPAGYAEWFGTASTERKSRVKSVFNSVASGMATNFYKLYYYGHTCKDSLYGYTWYKSMNIILCKKYFTAGNTGYGSKMGTIIHELTQSAADTKNLVGAHGTTGALNLAQADPDKATDNADNYQYFAESI